MTTATETATMDLYTARKEIEAVIKSAAAQIWTEIFECLHEKGIDATQDLLSRRLETNASCDRLTSRSTSMISNLMDDVQHSVISSAYFALVKAIREADGYALDNSRAINRNSYIRTEMDYARKNHIANI